MICRKYKEYIKLTLSQKELLLKIYFLDSIYVSKKILNKRFPFRENKYIMKNRIDQRNH